MQSNENKQKDERERKTKESYSVAKKNLVSWSNDAFSTWQRRSRLCSLFLSPSLYMNIFIVSIMIFCIYYDILSSMIFFMQIFFVLFWVFSTSSKRRSRRSEVFYEIGVLKNFAKFTGKHLFQSLFFDKVPAMRPVILFKKRLQHRCATVNYSKF